MWCARHTRRGLAAAPRPARVIAALLVLLLASAAAALPRPTEALDAFTRARAAVDALVLPDALADPPDTTGCAVTLRAGGRVVARTTATAPDALRTALRGAIAEFSETSLVPRDATRRDTLASMAPSLRLEIEFAGALTPLAGDTFDAAAISLSPGLHGVAAAAGNQTEAVFPGAMLSTGTRPARAIEAACSTLGLPAAPLGELRRTRSVKVFRFDTLHLAQLEPLGSPVFLHRGGRVRTLREVVGTGLESFGQDLAGALERRLWPGDEPRGILGTYDPTRDRYAPLTAPPREQALAALALARWARAADDHAAGIAATRILYDLAEAGLESSSASVRALVILARGELGLESDLSLEAADAAGSPLSTRALVAAALAHREDPGAAELARGVLAEAGRDRVVSAAPWIIWALSGGSTVAGAPLLRDARDVLFEHQITRADAGTENADLAGGIVFTASAQLLPTAQSARAAAMAAAMLAPPGLTPASEGPRELARLLQTLRFLRQLAAGPAEAAMFPQPARVLGGVRLALWDARQPPDATSMALLAVADTLLSTR